MMADSQGWLASPTLQPCTKGETHEPCGLPARPNQYRRMLAPLDSPTMSGFVARLDEINALADGSPGFVWRLQTPEGDATSLRPWEDDMIIVNMSVWETREALFSYVYQVRALTSCVSGSSGSSTWAAPSSPCGG